MPGPTASRIRIIMERFYIAGDLQEAHLLLHRLETERIDAHIFNENAQGAVGELPFTHIYPEIWLVNREDLARAKKVVAEYERPIAALENQKCKHCGEESPGTFEVCWQCGEEF